MCPAILVPTLPTAPLAPLGATAWHLHLAPPLGASTRRHHLAPPLDLCLASPLGATTWRHHLAPAFHGVGPTPWNAVTFGPWHHHSGSPWGEAPPHGMPSHLDLAPPLGTTTWRHHFAPAFHGVGPTPWNAVTFGPWHHHSGSPWGEAPPHGMPSHLDLAPSLGTTTWSQPGNATFLRNNLRNRWPPHGRSPRCNYPLASRFLLLMGSGHC